MKIFFILFIPFLFFGCGESKETLERTRVAERLKEMEKESLEERLTKEKTEEQPQREKADSALSACIKNIDSLKKEAEAEKIKNHHKRVTEILKPCYGTMTDGDAIAMYINSSEINTKQEKRKSGIYLGMTKEDVVLSSWGRPLRTNKTHTSYGTREQWIYKNNNYLYFDNNELIIIQN